MEDIDYVELAYAADYLRRKELTKDDMVFLEGTKGDHENKIIHLARVYRMIEFLSHD